MHTALRRGWKTAVLPISFDAAGVRRFDGFTFLYYRVLLKLRLASSPVLCVPDSIVAGRGRPALHQQAFGFQ